MTETPPRNPDRVCVFQSYRTTNVPEWISKCMGTVRSWTEQQGYDYRFFGDEIFDLLPGWYRDQCAGHIWPMSDLARLLAAKQMLAGSYARVIWIDADFLVFNPGSFRIPIESDFAFCREPWIGPHANYLREVLRKPIAQLRRRASWQSYYTQLNVNNACFHMSDCWFLDSYIQSVLYAGKNMSKFRKQHMGTDMLTAYHGILRFPLIRHVGAFSWFVVTAIADANENILRAYSRLAGEPLHAANVCNSDFEKAKLRHDRAISTLMETKGEVVNRFLTANHS